jgi:hypothetical protein
MYLVAVALVLAQQPVPFQPITGISGKGSGDMQLISKSNWHNLDINVTFKGAIGLTTQDLKLFEPPAATGLDQEWTVKDTQLLPLVRILHGVAWKASAADAAAFERWRGSASSVLGLQPAGTLTLTCIKDGPGYRLEFGGKIKVVEVKSHGNRFGPNYQQDQWTHEVLGAIILTEQGVPFGVEIRDTFEVAGKFYNGANTSGEENSRKGTLLVSMPVTVPLSPERVSDIKRLVGELGDESFAVRERALGDLLQLSASVAPYLRQFGLSHADAEVRQRCDWLLKKLLEE